MSRPGVGAAHHIGLFQERAQLGQREPCRPIFDGRPDAMSQQGGDRAAIPFGTDEDYLIGAFHEIDEFAVILRSSGEVIGDADSHRFPFYFEINVHIERRFTFRGYRLAVRAGVNNLTDHLNPSAVNNVAGSPQYLRFLGAEGRHMVVRVRFFGRAKGK